VRDVGHNDSRTGTHGLLRLRFILYTFGLDLLFGENRMGSNMVAIARALDRAHPAPGDIETLKQLGLLAGAGLLVSLVLMSYGLDLSPGFF
jgi:hypothetical protein